MNNKEDIIIEDKKDETPPEPQAPEKPTRKWEWLPEDGKHDLEE